MKLRLRSLDSKETLRIEVPDQSTLDHLKQTLLRSLSSSLPADSLRLSLNRKDELRGPSPEDSLHSMGITSGDLVFFAFNPSALASQGGSSSESPQVLEGKQIQGADCDLKKPRLENCDAAESNLDSDCEEMDAEDEPIGVVEKKCSRPIFLRRVLKEELGYDRNAHKLLVTAVHAVLLESGFVMIDPNLGAVDNHFHMPEDWPSPSFSMSLWYTLPELLAEGGRSSTMTEIVLLKFQSLGHFVNVYGSLSCSRGSSVYRVSLDDRKFAPSLDLIWVDSVSSNIMDENEGNPEKQVFEFWKVVKDALALPLLIDLCEKTGLPPPASFTLLPADVKLKILEALPAVDIARVECVCTELRYLASSNELWKLKVSQEFGFEDDGRGTRIWKAKYVSCLAKEKLRHMRISNVRDLVGFRRPFLATSAFRRGPHIFPAPHVIGGDYDIAPGYRRGPAYGHPGQALGRLPRRNVVYMPNCDLRGR